MRELWSGALHGKKWIKRERVLDGGWAPQNDRGRVFPRLFVLSLHGQVQGFIVSSDQRCILMTLNFLGPNGKKSPGRRECVDRELELRSARCENSSRMLCMGKSGSRESWFWMTAGAPEACFTVFSCIPFAGIPKALWFPPLNDAF